MIYQIELNNEYANQEFDIKVPNSEINRHILLQTTENDSLLMSIFVDDVQIGQPFICCPNQYVVPYQYMQELLGGNFVFETEKNNYPSFENFGKNCSLYFVTADEINEQ